MKQILIAGGRGLIGQELTKHCCELGYNVTLLSRTKKSTNDPKEVSISVWNPYDNIIDLNVLQKADIVINLAGENIAEKRWTNVRKKQIINSRVDSSRFLINTILENNISLDKYISASAIGYYGNRPKEILSETSKKGDGFLSDVCHIWEKSLEPLEGKIPYNILRFGMVLAKQGGALTPMKKGLPLISPYFGKGDQYISWIHICDLCEMILYTSERSFPNGIINAVAPAPVSALFFARKLALTSNLTPLLIPIPKFLARLILGEMGDLMLDDTNVDSTKIEELGFNFQYRSIEETLLDLK